MKSTIDRAGRIVIPRELRQCAGLVPGEVEVIVDGAGVSIRPIGGNDFIERDGVLVIPAAGVTIDDDVVQDLRDAARR